MAPLAAATQSMYDLGAQLTASWNQLHAGSAKGGQPDNPEKNPCCRIENQYKLNPLIELGLGIEPGPHWWEASALTTAPSLHPKEE